MPLLANVDETKLIAVMAAGTLFALAGLALLFRRGPQGGEQLAEFLGLKFRFSSTGLVVFLVGALLVAAPLFVGESRPPSSGGSPPPTATATPSPAPGQPVAVAGKEAEPNNHVSEANRIAIGKTYKGALKTGDLDFFVFENTLGEENLRLIIRMQRGAINADIFAENEERVFSRNGNDIMSVPFRLPATGNYYLRLKPIYGTDYEMIIQEDK